jgi:hypothetical protein
LRSFAERKIIPLKELLEMLLDNHANPVVNLRNIGSVRYPRTTGNLVVCKSISVKLTRGTGIL